MSVVRGLAYADWRGLVNAFHQIRRSPGRLALWLLSPVVLGLFVLSRSFAPHPADAHPRFEDIARADLLVGGFLLTFVVMLALGRGFVGLFRTAAEARWIIGSPVPPSIAIAYLQAREAIAQSLRFLSSFVYLLVFTAPRAVSVRQGLLDLVLVMAALVAFASLLLPRRFAPQWSTPIFVLAGLPLAALAALPIVRDGIVGILSPAPLTTALSARLPAWHPGMVLFVDNAPWVALLLLVALAAVLLLAAIGRDAYPELYAISMAHIEHRERVRGRRGFGARIAAPGLLPPAGVMALLWKSYVEFRRRVPLPLFIGMSLLWLVAGAATARLSRWHEAVFVTVIGTLANAAIVLSLTVRTELAAELRRPIFWLSAATLYERLWALALGQMWRYLFDAAMMAAGLALGGAPLQWILAVPVGGCALVVLLTGIGYASFAFFPSALDQRGPLAALRLFVSYVLLLPPLAVFTVAAIGLRSAGPAFIAAAVLALAEGAVLMGIAAWRLDGRVDRLAVHA